MSSSAIRLACLLLVLAGSEISRASETAEPPSILEVRRLPSDSEAYRHAMEMINKAQPPKISLEEALGLARKYQRKIKLDLRGVYLSGIRYVERQNQMEASYSGSYPVWVLTYSLNYSVREVRDVFYVPMDGKVSAVGIRQ